MPFSQEALSGNQSGQLCFHHILSLFLHFLNLLCQSRTDHIQILNNTVIRNIKEGGIGIRIHCNDNIGFLHPVDVGKGAGYSEADVQLRRNRFSGNTNLIKIVTV